MMLTGEMGPFEDLEPAIVKALTRYGTEPYRRTVTVRVRDIGSWRFDDLPDNIDGWVQWLNEARAETPREHRAGLSCVLSYERGSYDSGDTASLTVSYQRPETDEEMKERVGRGLAYLREQDAKERYEYQKLKAKFEAP